jgi:hypothetical protein
MGKDTFDQEAQDIYAELRRRNVHKSDPEAGAILGELVKRGVLKDLSQPTPQNMLTGEELDAQRGVTRLQYGDTKRLRQNPRVPSFSQIEQFNKSRTKSLSEPSSGALFTAGASALTAPAAAAGTAALLPQTANVLARLGVPAAGALAGGFGANSAREAFLGASPVGRADIARERSGQAGMRKDAPLLGVLAENIPGLLTGRPSFTATAAERLLGSAFGLGQEGFSQYQEGKFNLPSLLLSTALGGAMAGPANRTGRFAESAGASAASRLRGAATKAAPAVRAALPPPRKASSAPRGLPASPPAIVRPQSGFTPTRARVTDYGSRDPKIETTPDTNSLKGVGAFPHSTKPGSLKENYSFALSPDKEAEFRAAGVRPGDEVSLTLADGRTVAGRWDDRTSTKLTGRIDFYSPSGVSPLRDARVVGFAKSGGRSSGRTMSESVTLPPRRTAKLSSSGAKAMVAPSDPALQLPPPRTTLNPKTGETTNGTQRTTGLDSGSGEPTLRDGAGAAAVGGNPKQVLPGRNTEPGMVSGGDRRATGPGTADGQPGASGKEPALRIEEVDPKDLGVLPGIQYKRGVDKSGVTDLLKGQKDYQVEFGDTLTAFRDTDGKLYAVDGHHRRELAQRAERFSLPQSDGSRVEVPRKLRVNVLDAADGWTKERAKSYGVIKNLRENKGVAIDAADALAEGMGSENARAEASKLPKTSLARDVSGLVLLDEAGRAQVRNKQVPGPVGAAIGEVLRGDTARQKVALEQARVTSGVTSYEDGAALARAVKDEDIVLRQDSQGSMFGDDEALGGERYQSTAGEQAAIVQGVKRRLQNEQSGLLAVEKTTAREGEAFDVAGRRAEAGQVAEARSKADALLEFDPDVKTALRQTAADVMNGRIGRDEGVTRVREVLLAGGKASLADIVKKGGVKPGAPAPGGGGLFSEENTQSKPNAAAPTPKATAQAPKPEPAAPRGAYRSGKNIHIPVKSFDGAQAIMQSLPDGVSARYDRKNMEVIAEGVKSLPAKFGTVAESKPGTAEEQPLPRALQEETEHEYLGKNKNGEDVFLDPSARRVIYKQGTESAEGLMYRGKPDAQRLENYRIAQSVQAGAKPAPESVRDLEARGGTLAPKSPASTAGAMNAPGGSLPSRNDAQNALGRKSDPNTGKLLPPNLPPPPRVMPSPIKDSNAAKAPREIVFDLQKSLGRKFDFGAKGRRKNVLGSYFTGSKRTTIRWAGDLDTTAHELGHLLDDQFGLVKPWSGARGKSPFDGEILGQFAMHGSPSKLRRVRRMEGVAEYVRAYLINPAQAKAQAPNFTRHFEDTVPADQLAKLRAFGDDIRRFGGLSASEMGDRAIAWSPGRKSVSERLIGSLRGDGLDFQVTGLDKLKVQLFDENTALLKGIKHATSLKGETLLPESDPEILLRLYQGGTSKADQFITKQMPELLKPLVEGNERDFTPEELDTLQRETARYMIAERTLELGARKNPDGTPALDPDRVSGLGGGLYSAQSVARDIIAEAGADPARLARIQKAAEAYRKISRELLETYRDSGRISQEQLDTITDSNKFYVSFKREKSMEGDEFTFDTSLPLIESGAGGGMGKAPGQARNAIKRVKGSLDAIQNPYLSLVENAYSIIQESDRNKVMRSIRDILQPTEASAKEGANLAAIGFEVPGGRDASGKPVQPKDTVAIWIDGKAEYWHFPDADVRRAIEGFAKAAPDMGTKAAQAWGNLLRSGVTLSPGYAVRNRFRDAITRPFLSRVGGTVLDEFGKLPKGIQEEFLTAGGGQFGMHLATRKGYEQAMKSAVQSIRKDAGAIGFDASPGALLNGYKKILEGAELRGRLVEYNKAKRYALDTLGYDEKNAMLYAAFQARDLMDFAVAGTAVRKANQLIPFLNAGVQGLRRTAIAIRENPTQVAKSGAALGIASAAVLAFNAMQGEEALKEYREIAPQRRDLFFCVRLGQSGKWLFIPKGFELAAATAPIERSLNWALGDKRAWDGYFSDSLADYPAISGTLAQTLMPIQKDDLAGPFRSVVEVMTNFNFFTGKSIVPSYENDKPLDQRDTTRSTRAAQLLQKVFRSDARKIDTFAGSTFGNLGRTAMQVSDLGRPDKPQATAAEFFLSQTGIVGNAPATTAQSVQRLQKQAREAGVPGNPLKAEVKALGEARTQEAYQSARKKLLDTARDPATIRSVADKGRAIDAWDKLKARNGMTDEQAQSAAAILRGMVDIEEKRRGIKELAPGDKIPLQDAAFAKLLLVEKLAGDDKADSEEIRKARRAAISSKLRGVPPEQMIAIAKQYGVSLK